MVARQNAHDFAALGIDSNVRPQRIHHVDGFGLCQFPRARGKGIGFGGQRANRAQINDVALQITVERLVQIGSDFGIFATPGLAHFKDSGHFGRKPHTAGAGNAPRHMGFNQGTKVKIFVRALGFAEPAEIDAVRHRLILQVTLAGLIADRAIQRMVDQQKFHHTLAGASDHGRVGSDQRRLSFRARAQILDLHRTACRGLWRAANHFDQTHAAVACDGQPFMVAKTRNFHTCHFGGLNDGHCTIDFNLDAVDADFLEVGHKFTPPPLGCSHGFSMPARLSDRTSRRLDRCRQSSASERALPMPHPALARARLAPTT